MSSAACRIASRSPGVGGRPRRGRGTISSRSAVAINGTDRSVFKMSRSPGRVNHTVTGQLDAPRWRTRRWHTWIFRARRGTQMGSVVLGQLTSAVADVLHALLQVYFWILVAAGLISWVSPDPRNPVVQFLHRATSPVLSEVRRRLPFVYASGIDFSPLVVIVLIQVIDRVVVGSLYALAGRLLIGAIVPGVRVG